MVSVLALEQLVFYVMCSVRGCRNWSSGFQMANLVCKVWGSRFKVRELVLVSRFNF
jgi:hypothetical protein